MRLGKRKKIEKIKKNALRKLVAYVINTFALEIGQAKVTSKYYQDFTFTITILIWSSSSVG